MPPRNEPGPLAGVLHAVLKPSGFRRKGDTWYGTGERTVLVVNLQASKYGTTSYLNIAVGVPELGCSAQPKEFECEARIRVAALAPDDRQRLEKVMDLGCAEFGDPERAHAFRDFLTNNVLPFLGRIRSLDGLREEVGTGAFTRGIVDYRLKEWLGMS